LTTDNRQALYVPAGCAFGFLTTADDTEVFYQMSEFFYPETARGFRYDDPAFNIRWPEAPAVISPRDLAHTPFAVA
jgi:dTDP-4-dehydrorhamnose 3,5-epimerase